MRILSSLILGLMLSSSTYAGVCELSIKRVACPGKEKESYAKCEGKESCTQKKKAENEAECKKLAESECSNSRTEITKSKEISATFAGKDATGGNICKADRPDFNKYK